MIELLDFGRTGHRSARVLFGAAAVAAMRQAKADATFEVLREFGVNHIDVAASYGEAELRLAPFLAQHRDAFFLATKTGERGYEAARAQIEASRSRMQVDCIDLIQFHNLTDRPGWERVFAEDGALKAAVEARDAGHVRHIGVTGHGTYAAEMHSLSLDRFAFDSVLLPYNFTMMQDPIYAQDFEALMTRCQAEGVAVQTIKSIARRRWREDDPSPRFSWYEPLRDPEAIARATGFVLDRAGTFLNSSSDATLLRPMLEAADAHASQTAAMTAPQLQADVQGLGIEPLFVRDVLDGL
jgi:aryl-alcohol dehydrogenase-like predicted oxidoreductase